MTIDERIQALTRNLELISHDAQIILAAAKQDSKNIQALARIAETRERQQ
jgi:hypothetical protein